MWLEVYPIARSSLEIGCSCVEVVILCFIFEDRLLEAVALGGEEKDQQWTQKWSKVGSKMDSLGLRIGVREGVRKGVREGV